MRLNRNQQQDPFVPSPGTTILPAAEQFRRLAARQREIAATVPSPRLRERFLASAERMEAQALLDEQHAKNSPRPR